MRIRKGAQKGFISLIGILITLVILAILISISMTTMMGGKNSGSLNESAILKKVNETLEDINLKQEEQMREFERLQNQ